MGLGVRGDTSTAEMSLLILNHHSEGVGPACSTSLPHLPVSTSLLLSILSYRDSVLFSWLLLVLGMLVYVI